jgi:glyoxylase-like metal-dependent hydrolase (beta-lactamase superfamily II)
MMGPALDFNRPGIETQLPGYIASIAARVNDLEATAPGSADLPRLEKLLAEDREFLDAKRNVRLTFPDLTFTNELDIHLGKRLIRIMNDGPAVTPGDAFLYLPQEQILVTGDLLVNPISWTLSCYPSGWLKTLEHLDALDARVIIPGHGPPLVDESLLHATMDVFRILLRHGRESYAAGIDVDKARATILPELADLRRQITHGDPPLEQAFDVQLVDWYLHRVYDEESGPLGDAIAPIPAT